MSYNRYKKYLHIQPVRKISESLTDIYHTLKSSETVDQLALKYYGDPNLEWIIMAGNPEWFMSFQIPAGTILRIPFSLERVFSQWGINNEV